MAALPVRNNTTVIQNYYGEGPYYVLHATLAGNGSGNLKIAAPGATTLPPCQVEILSAVHTATGTWTLTFADSYFAVADWNVSIDDINGATPVSGYLGQFANLNTTTPMTCVLTTYAAGAAADVAANTPVRINIVFKRESTGATA
jgi:hypothetical protein